MPFNETLLILMSVFATVFVFLAWKLDKERLYSIILIFLILISITGGKIVELFGFATNTGNVFYAAIFLATYFLIERYGKKEGIRSIWVGFIGIVFFLILLQLTLAMDSAPITRGLSDAFMDAFEPVSRVGVASLFGFVVSQTVNVYLYVYLRDYFDRKRLWLRANLANAAAQLVDSALFFLIAFSSVVPPDNILTVLITGFAIKVLYMMLASPLLYLNRLEEGEEEDGYATLTLR